MTENRAAESARERERASERAGGRRWGPRRARRVRLASPQQKKEKEREKKKKDKKASEPGPGHESTHTGAARVAPRKKHPRGSEREKEPSLYLQGRIKPGGPAHYTLSRATGAREHESKAFGSFIVYGDA